MKILITGASGFIGTNALEYFSKKAEVVNIDSIEPRCKEHLSYWKRVDLCNLQEVEDAFVSFSPDYIIHLAARTDLNGKDLHAYDVNITGVRNVLSSAEKCPNIKKILIASSMLVCRAGYMPQNNFDYCPTTLYGESKVETENIVWSNKPSCDWAIIRPTSMWGPWFSVPYRNFFDMVKKGVYFHIGHRSSTKTYGYIENAVYQIEKILFADTKDEDNKVFYLGDDPATCVEDWANEIGMILDRKIIRLPFWFVKVVACFGDILAKCNIWFPMYSFRLKNMTTDNIIDLRNTYKLAPCPPYNRIQGTKKTLEWMSKHPERKEESANKLVKS